MKVLVVGREGQVARSLVERASLRRGLNLLAIGRPDVNLEEPGSAFQIIQANNPDVVINAAAFTAVDRAETEVDLAQRINSDAAGEVAAAAAHVGAIIIQLSTDYVFNGSGSAAYSEDARTSPLGVYGRTKLLGEDKVRAANPRHAIVRTAWVYSPFGRNFVKTMMAAAKSRDTLTVVNDQIGNPSSALDLADGLFAMIERYQEQREVGLGQVYHLAGTGSASWYEFALAIMEECALWGVPRASVKPIPTAGWPTPAGRPLNSRLSSEKFETDFGFAMPPWRRSLANVVKRLAIEL